MKKTEVAVRSCSKCVWQGIANPAGLAENKRATATVWGGAPVPKQQNHLQARPAANAVRRQEHLRAIHQLLLGAMEIGAIVQVRAFVLRVLQIATAIVGAAGNTKYGTALPA
jgi:hypothetical protein